MKIDGLTHPKTKDLAIRLGVSLPHAVGLLEFLWYFVGKQTPQGNIGKWSNGVIAAESQWSGDADEFVECLVSSGFVDRCQTHRLVIHDWSDHAPRWVFAKLKASGKKILRPDLSAPLSDDLSGGYKGSEVKCSEGKGSAGNNPPVEFAKREPDRADEIRDVFAYWQTELNHPRAKLDDKRKRKIRDRLKDGYTARDLKDAIDGIQKSPHHMGENDRATVYDDIELICRDGPHVDKFIKFSQQGDRTSMGSAARKTATAAERWLQNG